MQCARQPAWVTSSPGKYLEGLCSTRFLQIGDLSSDCLSELFGGLPMLHLHLPLARWAKASSLMYFSSPLYTSPARKLLISNPTITSAKVVVWTMATKWVRGGRR